MYRINLLLLLILLIISPCIFATNIAIGAGVTASGSSASGSNPGNIVDGNYGSFSQIYGSGNSAWWQLDLHEIKTVGGAHYEGLGYNPGNGISYLFTEYKIDAYVDNVWTNIVYITNNTTVSNDHTFDAVDARYWKFTVVHSNWRDPLFFEFELHEFVPTYNIPEPQSLLLIIASISLLYFKFKK